VRAIATRCFSPPDNFKPAFAHHAIVAGRQLANDGIDLRQMRGLQDLLLARANAAIGDVVADGVVEQHGVLRHDADGRAQGRLRHVADVLPVDGHAARLDVVKAIKDSRDGGLAGPCRTHHRDGFSGRHPEADALQDRAVVVVGKNHVLEFDVALRDDQRLRIGLVLHLLRPSQQAEHHLHVDEALGDVAVDGAQEVQRNEQLYHQRVHHHHVADRHGALSHAERRQNQQTDDT
jgi:hypothetical protein